MLTASSFVKVSGKLGAPGQLLRLTAEMGFVTLLPGPIVVRNHQTSAQSSAWGTISWAKLLWHQPPQSAFTSISHCPQTSTPRGSFFFLSMSAGFLLQSTCINKKNKLICIFLISFILPWLVSLTYISILPLPLITYPKFPTSKLSACGKCYPQNPKRPHISNQVKVNQGRQEKLWKL